MFTEGCCMTQTPKMWYDCELYKMRRMLDQKGYLYAKCPCDPFIRGSYYKFRKLYGDT